MKKILIRLVSIMLVVCMIAPAMCNTVYAASESTKPITYKNEVIQFTVNNKGKFQIRTTEEGNPIRANDGNKSMLFYDGKNETSFTTFRIDGEDYIFGEDYAYSLSKKAHLVGSTMQMEDSVITTYQIGEDDSPIRVVQSLSVVKDKSNTNFGNVLIQYALQNKTGRNIEVGARILQDIMLGENDGPAIKMGDNFFDKEIELVGTDVPDVWRSTDNEFSPNIVGFGRTNGWGNVKPDKMIIGHWQGLSQTAYDYTVKKDDKGNSKTNFTIESNYGRRDTAVAYYWEPKTVTNESVTEFETYYGLGQIPDRVFTYAANISAPTQLVVNEAKTGYVNNGEFEVAVMIENNLANSEEIYDVMGYLTYEDSDGAVMLDNDAALKGTKLIKVDGHYTFRWKLKAKAGVDYRAIKYKVDLYDRRNVYKDGDVIPKGKQVGDVKLDEIYTVSKALILPSLTGAPPTINFGTVAPNEIYYSGKNLITVNCTGIPLLTNKNNWQLEYRIGLSDYEVVESKYINVVQDTNSIEVMFDEQLPTGQMDFRVVIINDMYSGGTDTSKHILKGDILKIPGKVSITKDKTVMPRTYGILAIVSDVTYDGVYDFSYTTHAVPLSGEDDLRALRKALEDANKKDLDALPMAYKDDLHEREVLTVINGDIRTVRDGGKLSKYVVYASHKKAMINNIITYTSAMPLTIQFNSAVNTIKKRTSIDWLNENGGMSDTLKNIIKNDTQIDDNFANTPDGVVGLIANEDVVVDFTYVDKASDDIGKTKRTIDFISGVGSALAGQGNLNDLINDDQGVLAITGLGILGINSGDGFDFWMDMFTVEFKDDTQYTLWEPNNETVMPVRFNLEGVGSVLNKAMEGLPVQIGGVRLAYDADNELDMLTFDATVDLTMLPGGVVVNAEDIFFSTKGYEGIIVNAHVEPDGKIGIIEDLVLDVGIDTYNGGFSIKGEAQIKVVKAEIEFALIKERKNDTWYLNDAVLKGGGTPGIQIFPGVFITGLGGGVRNLAQLTNPYYDNPDAIFTVVLLMDLNVVRTLEGSFEGQITKRYIQVEAETAKIKGLDIFRDLGVKLCWDTDGEEAFYIQAKGSMDFKDILVGKATVYISDIFFEGTAKMTFKIPDSVSMVGGMELSKIFFGINNDKVWGALKINLFLFSVEVGATFWWRGKFEVNVGEAGPVENNEAAMLPKGALYEGTTVDHNGETVDYSIGTNIDIHHNSIKQNSPIQMKVLASESSEFVGNNVPITESENVYLKDSVQIPETKYVYDVTTDVEAKTKLVFGYQKGDDDEKEPQIELYNRVKDEVGKDTDELKETKYTNLSFVKHVNDDKNYITVTGFEEPKVEEKLVVVSDTPLINYITYTETISDELGDTHLYEFTLDTDVNTKIAFNNKKNSDLKLKFYKHTGTTFDGKKVIGDIDGEITSKTIAYGGNKIIVYEGFTPNLKAVKIIASANKEITEHALVNHIYNIDARKTSTLGSSLVAQFMSTENIKDAEVLYVTDDDDNLIQLPEDKDLSSLYSEVNGYHTMLFPLEKEGMYHVYSTIEIDSNKSKLFEVEQLPVLYEDSIVFKTNAKSNQKLDITWDGDYYRYTYNEAKGYGKTVFSYYLVDANEEILDSENDLIDVDGTHLGIYDIEEGGLNKFTVDIPKTMNTGDYRIKVVQATEGLCQRFAYSDKILHYVNPNSPSQVANVIAEPYGNGFLKVGWDDNVNENIEEYYIEVFDGKKNFIKSFGTASVPGDTKQALIGGVYETFNPDKPEKSEVKGLETDKDYIIGITPLKKIDNELTMFGPTEYSKSVRLPKPNPVELNIEFDSNINTVDVNEESYEVNNDGSKSKQEIVTKGIKTKSPVIKLESDQEFTSTIYLDKVKLQENNSFSNNIDLQLNRLTEGVHYMDVVTKNRAGDKNYTSFKFYVDTRAPELLIENPKANQSISSGSNKVRVNGRTEIGAIVRVNGETVTVNDKGLFDKQIELKDNKVKNEILIEAEDNYGNVTKNKTIVVKNVSQIEDIVIKSDVPNITKTIKKPIYKTTSEQMMNVFTKKMVEVPISTDEVIGYDEEIATENIVDMGKEYVVEVKGVEVNSSNEVDIDQSKVNLEIVEGKVLADLSEDGKLSVHNNGVIVVKATYEVLGDNADTEKDESYSFTKYLTMTSEFKDIYTDDENNNNNNNNNNNSHKKPEDREKIYNEKDIRNSSIYVKPIIFEKLKKGILETIKIDMKDYTIVLKNPQNANTSTYDDSDESLLSSIPQEEKADFGKDEVIVPLSPIDLSLAFDSPNEEKILSKIGGKANEQKLLTLHFRHHGKLPIRAKVNAKIGKINKNLYMYYYNEQTGELELYGLVKSNEKGEIAFEIDHCSDYVFVESLIANNDNFVDNVNSMAYISGRPDGTFGANNVITRAEVVTMLANLLKDKSTSEELSFVDTEMWAKDYIKKLHDYGYINGYSDGTFKPNDKITRAELAKLFMNIVNPTRSSSFRKQGFSDIDNCWAKEEIMMCYRLGIVNGSNGKYHPNDFATRAEVVTMINNMLRRQNDVSKKVNPFSDLDKKHWAYKQILNAIK